MRILMRRPTKAILSVWHVAAMQGRMLMTWNAPKITEVSLALEINSYVCAEIG